VHRLHIRLVEGREDSLRVVKSGVQREVGLAVRVVGEAVHARSGP
jgi:hypothetical protein